MVVAQRREAAVHERHARALAGCLEPHLDDGVGVRVLEVDAAPREREVRGWIPRGDRADRVGALARRAVVLVPRQLHGFRVPTASSAISLFSFDAHHRNVFAA